MALNGYVRIGTEDFESFFALMEKDFPPTERRSKDDALRVLSSVSCYSVFGVKEKERVLAFSAYWLFEECCFVDHLVVEDDLRGQGVGSDMIMKLIKEIDIPIVLEVEPPEDEIAKKRIRFYEKLGFKLNDHTYIQPSMQEGQPEIQMMMMSYPETLNFEEFKNIQKRIFSNAYNVDMDQEDA